MDRPLAKAVSDVVARATGHRADVVSSRPVGGGCIHDARTVTLDDGRRVFVKASAQPAPHIFEREAEGLGALGAAEVLRVPAVFGHGDAGGTAFLVMEAIDAGAPGPGFFEAFGEGLAQLHRAATADRWGFSHDNYIGATPQPNPWRDDWTSFWHGQRLGHQLTLARRAGLSDPELDRLGDRILDRLGDLLGDVDEPPALLHGDLWSGNYLVGPRGEPVLIDPAVYYGHREADLAMARLFGGFPDPFYRAYGREWPLAPGSERRLVLYELYHMLNHLNLFGTGYRSGCISRMRRLT
ncbi:MAG: fructosamine kinase family protein [Acidobacteriota bacterium]